MHFRNNVVATLAIDVYFAMARVTANSNRASPLEKC